LTKHSLTNEQNKTMQEHVTNVKLIFWIWLEFD